MRNWMMILVEREMEVLGFIKNSNVLQVQALLSVFQCNLFGYPFWGEQCRCSCNGMHLCNPQEIIFGVTDDEASKHF